jgi:death on curing protein
VLAEWTAQGSPGDEPVYQAPLLEAALARTQATAFGQDAYSSLDAKAAALLHSLARNQAATAPRP